MNPPEMGQQLRSAIAIAWASFGSKASDDTLNAWARELAAYDSPELRLALKEAASGEARPNLGAVKARYYHLRDSRKASKPMEVAQLTPAERKRSDYAAIMSALWLHYEHRWTPEQIAGHVIGRVFGGNPVAAVEAAISTYSRFEVFKWMEDATRNAV